MVRNEEYIWPACRTMETDWKVITETVFFYPYKISSRQNFIGHCILDENLIGEVLLQCFSSTFLIGNKSTVFCIL